MTTPLHRFGRLAVAAAVAIASVALITGGDAAAEPATTAGFDVSYDDRVWGDFILAGNTQVRCVTAGDLDVNDVDGDGNTTESVGSAVGFTFYAECLNDATRDTFGTPQAPNDQRWMVHQNVDPGAGLFNSSTATITVPPGATIASAELVWHGNNGEANSTGLTQQTQIDLMNAGESMAAFGAAGAEPWPSCQASSSVIDWGTYGTPVAWATAPLVAARQNAAWAAMVGRDRTQVQLQLGAGTGYQTITSTSGQIGAPFMSGQLYQESADITDLLTAALPGDGSPLEITVGDIFTPEGFNCTGGWYTIIVWEYPTLNPTYAPELRRVQIWDGFAEVSNGASESFMLNGFLAAPGWVVEPRAASVGYEGDQQIAGDSLLLNGLPVLEPRVSGGVTTDNFYASTIGEFTNSTIGDFTRSNPEIRDAAGIDIKTVPVAATALNSVLGGLPVTFQTAGDRYAASLFVFSAKEAVLSGTVYHDVDADGVFTAGVDTPIEGVEVTLTGNDDLGNPVSMSATTDENGFYVFVQVPASDLTGYTLTETQPANYLEGDASAGTLGGVVDSTNEISGLVYDPIVGATGYDFGEIVPASIAGSVVDDSGNGIAGVDITLTGIDHDGSPVLVVVQTDANGDYLFDGLLPGTYVVTETQPLGYGDGVETAGSTGGDISTNDVIAAIVVDQGDASTGNDFAETTGSVSGSVVDQNGDPIANVSIALSGTDVDGTVAVTTTTDANGDYLFDGLLAGTYTVTETQPAGYLDGDETAGSLGGDLSTNDVIAAIPLLGGQDSIDNDFAEFQPSTIAGSVVDQDGVGIAGVEITLSGTDVNGDVVTLTTTTDADGDYSFTDLLPGTYTVTETQPAGYLDGDETAGSLGGDLSTNDVIAAIVLGANQSSTGNDFAEYQPASISGSVVDDFGDPIAGVEIVLSGTDVNGDPVSASTTTDANGDYSFTNLLPGTYDVAETQPTGYGDGVETAGSTGGDISTNDVIAAIPLAGGQDSVGNDFAETTGSVSGSVVDDFGNPIAGVEIVLTGTDVNGDPVSASTTTDANGDYVFEGLLAGTYEVAETQPTGYGDGAETAGSTGGDISTDDVIAAIPLAGGQDSVDNDFAETTGSVSGSVVDDFGSGIAGVEIVLSGTDVNGDPVSASTTTDANGDYVFDGLLAGTYEVTETQPTGYGDGVETAGSTGGDISTNDVIAAIPLADGQDSVDNDFAELTGAISGSVVDDFGNGIAGVEIVLTGTDANGDPVSLTTTTDADGGYIFENLLAGIYAVAETQPTGYGDGVETAGSTGGDISTNDVIAAIPLADGEVSIDNDFAETTGAISGSVVDDFGNPIAGVEIVLSGIDVNGDPVSASTTTDANGDYVFENLLAGTYAVAESQPAGYGDGAESAGSTGGDISTNDVIAAIPLAGGQDSVGNDFAETTGSVSGSVVDDFGNPIAGVEIVLTGTDVNGDPVSASTTTDANGDYVFDGLLAGTYEVTETQPAGYGDGVETAGSTGGDISTDDVIAAIPLAGGQDSVDNDFAETTGSVSGSVVDDFGNPIAGVEIVLTGTDANGDPVLATATTDASGDYAFENLLAGTYEVAESQPAGYGDGAETAGSTGGDISTDDVIAVIPLAGGQDSVGNDFAETTGSVSGSVVDDFGNPIAGVEISLSGIDVNGDPVSASTTTDANGDYVFENLLAGTYAVTESQPVGYGDGVETAGSTGGDISTNDVIAAIPLAGGEDSVGNDFAETTGSVSGSVVDDFGNGIADVIIILLGTDATGTPVSASTTTDANGDYGFENLLAGTYEVAEVQPTGYGDGAETAGSTGGDISTNDVIAAIPLAGGQDSVDNDFAELTGAISGSVVDDFNNGIAGVEIVLTGTDANGDPVSASTTTDANGDYVFEGLLAGTYEVTETQPTGYGDGTETAGSTGGDVSTDDVIAAIPLLDGEVSTDNDFAETTGSVSGSVVDDFNMGIAGVEIVLTGTDANGDPVSASTTTDANGDYVFDGLLAGTYEVTETQPTGYGDGVETAGSTGGDISTNDVIAAIPLADGEDSIDNDFAETTGSITGTVVVDGDGDPIAGVEIVLTGSDANGDPVSLTTTTDENGDYTFDNLLGGDYTVTETQPDGYGQGATNGDDTEAVMLPAGDDAVVDFSEATGSISGSVVDQNGDPIEGVEVALAGTDVNGDPVSLTTSTDADGDYRFDDLLAGDYTVTETQPSGLLDGPETVGSTGGDISTNDVIADIPLAGGQDSVDNDFAEYRPSGIAGSVVDQDDIGIADVTLTLTGTDVNGDPVSLSTTTDADGNYLFGDLLPGTYTVTETHPSGYLDGHEEAGSTGGDISTNDVIADIPLQAEESSYGHDFHEFVPASIEGSVFVDGDGEPIPGVVITLTGTDVNGDPVSLATTTDVDGSYSFVDLLPGDYVVTETQPDGYGAGVITPGNSIAIELAGGDESTGNDFSESTGSISGTVTDDLGRPLADVEITLTGTDVNGDPVDMVTTTDGVGDYTFVDLIGGDYTVIETQPNGYGPGGSAVGSTGGADGVNDIVGIELPGGVDSVDNDFVEETSTVSGVVRDDAGNPIAGVDVGLNGTDVNGNLVAQSTTTGTDGSYVFPGLVAGSYTISQTQPGGYSSVTAIPGTTGGSTDGTDVITSVTVDGSEDSDDNDFVETRIVTRTTSERELPFTGGSAGDLARVALLLAFVGGVLLLAGRRRRVGDVD